MKLSRAQFDKLALEHLDLLYRLARRLTRDQAGAEDLVQETYLRALRSADSFELQQFGIRPWLIRIMHNLHFTRGQREKRQPATMEDGLLDNIAVAPSFDHQPFNFDQLDERLAEAVEELPQDYQSVLLLWAIEDFSYKEVADACDVPIGTVMSRLHRARRKLVEKLDDYAKSDRVNRE